MASCVLATWRQKPPLPVSNVEGQLHGRDSRMVRHPGKSWVRYLRGTLSGTSWRTNRPPSGNA